MKDSLRPIMNKYMSDLNHHKNVLDYRRRQGQRVENRDKMLEPIVDMSNEYRKVRSNKTSIPKSVIRGTTSTR